MPLYLQSKNKGMLANITLIKANVNGSYEWVAILILKNEEPQINPSNTKRNKSKGLASLIFWVQSIYVT